MHKMNKKQEPANDPLLPELATAMAFRIHGIGSSRKRPRTLGKEGSLPTDGRLFGVACLLLSLMVLVFPLAAGLSNPKFFTLTFLLLLAVGCYCFDRGMPKFGRRDDNGKHQSSVG